MTTGRGVPADQASEEFGVSGWASTASSQVQADAHWLKVGFFGRVPAGQVVTDVNTVEMAQNLARVFGFTAIDALSVVQGSANDAVPPLAELVNDEDVHAALGRLSDAWTGEQPLGGPADLRVRAALEAYAADLLARLGRTP